MCEITSENFYSELPTIEAALNESAFVCLDMEFSKLHSSISNPLTYFDSTEERYYKLRKKVSDITCIQLGLGIFIYDADNKTFKTLSYSFYTYPQTFYKSDSIVHFQTSCVEFLNKYKFDFNKLFHSRVPYLTDEQESTIKLEMLDTLFFDKYFETYPKFRSIEEELCKVVTIVSEWYENADYGENTFLEINECNESAYIILMQYYILKKCKYLSINENENGLTITKIKECENSEKLNNQIYENLKLSLLKKMMGIKYVLKLLSKLKKPLVGHNCALDFLILCNQFFKPLPENFKDYQSFVQRTFGPIYDTKLLCKEIKLIMPKEARWSKSSLSEIYSYLKDGDGKIYLNYMSIKLFNIDETQNTKFHHAGWDAYYTGFCFIQMIHIIKKLSSKTKDGFHQRYTLTELLKSVEFYKYKLYAYRSLSNSIDLNADYHNNNQNNYIIIQNKGIFYTVLDLKELNYHLQENYNYDIKFLSNYTALIVTPSIGNCNRIINCLKSKYMIETYSRYQSRKLKRHILGLSVIIISTSVAVVLCLKK